MRKSSIGRKIKNGKLLTRVLAGELAEIPPIWLMRQAGRYLPEYNCVKEQAGDFLTLCLTPELAAEVSLQPIRRFNLDGAILFADILLVPYALGCDLNFVEGTGPKLSKTQSLQSVRNLNRASDIHETLMPVYDTVRILANQLPKNVALIGFAGSPWTVATYMILGSGISKQRPAREFAFQNPLAFEMLIEILIEATVLYLKEQIKAGADLLMLFDSWSGALSGIPFERYVIKPNRQIISSIRSEYPNIPIIAFPRGAGLQYVEFTKQVNAQCIGLDTDVDAFWAKKSVQTLCCVQSNLDPQYLVFGGKKLITETMRIAKVFSGRPYIFNLGHGIPPNAKPENVHIMVDTLRNQNWHSFNL